MSDPNTNSQSILDAIRAHKMTSTSTNKIGGVAAPPKADTAMDQLVEWANRTKERTEPKRAYDYSRIAEAVMDELVANELEDLLIVKNLEVGEWWSGVLAARKKVAELKRQKELAMQKAEDDYRAKQELLSRLTPEEKRLLGL